MASAAEIKAASAYVELVLRDKVSTALAAVGAKIKGWASSMHGIGMKAFGGALPGPVGEFMRMAMSPGGAFVGFQLAAKSFADAGHELQEASERTGMAVDQLSRLKYAAEMSGVELGTLEGAIIKMQRSLVEAAKGGKEQNEALRDLGLTAQDFMGKNGQEQFLLLAEKLDALKDPALKAAVAIKIFGRGAAEIFPLLAQGKEGIQGFMDEAERLGFVRGAETAKAADELYRKFRLVQTALRGVVNAIGEAVSGMQGDLLSTVTNLLLGLRDWIKSNRDLIGTIFRVVGAVVAGGGVLVAFSAVVSLVGFAFGGLATVMSGVASVIGFILSPIGLVTAAAAGLIYALARSGVLDEVFSGLGDAFSQVGAEFSSTMGAIMNALSSGNMGAAVGVAMAFIKLEWTRGINAIQAKWNGFTGWWTGVTYGLSECFISVVAEIKKVWQDAIGWLSRKWAEFAVSTFTESFANAITPIVAMIQGVDPNQIRENLKQDFALARAELPGKLEDINRERDARKAAIDVARNQAVAALDAMQKAERAGGGNLEGEAKQAPHAAIEAWENAMDAIGPAKRVIPAKGKAGVFGEGWEGGGSVFGTFSGRAFEMGGGGPLGPVVKQLLIISDLAQGVMALLGEKIATGIDKTADGIKNLKNAVFK